MSRTQIEVTCPVCGRTMDGAGKSGLVIPGHGTGWEACAGSYTVNGVRTHPPTQEAVPVPTPRLTQIEADAEKMRDLPDEVLARIFRALPKCPHCLGAGGEGEFVPEVLSWRPDDCRPCYGTGRNVGDDDAKG